MERKMTDIMDKTKIFKSVYRDSKKAHIPNIQTYKEMYVWSMSKNCPQPLPRFVTTPSSFNAARASRIDDLTVYFALNLFNQRQPYTKLPKALQRDVSVFFQSYKASQESARELLFSVADPDVIYQACAESFENGVGFLDHDHSLQVHSASVEELPSVLRTYIGCAEKLYGDVAQSDIVKVHIQSGKVTCRGP